MTTVTVKQNTTYDLTDLVTTFTIDTDIDVTTAGQDGVFGSAAESWVVTNLGSISGSTALFFEGNATFVNEGKVSNGTDIGACVYVGGVGHITNSGSIISSGTGNGSAFGGSSAIFLKQGGTVKNQISGTVFGNISLGATGTIKNAGVVSNSGQFFADIDLLAGGSATNSGKLKMVSGAHASGIYLVDGGTAINTGKITGSATNMSGIFLRSGGTATNNGIINLSSSQHIAALQAANGGQLVNTGTINVSVSVSNGSGIELDNGGTITNSGTVIVSSPADGSGIYLGNGGTLNNLSGGTIQAGTLDAVYVGGSAGVKIINAGTISGSNSIYLANAGASGAAITNKIRLESGSNLLGAVVGSTGSFVTNDLVLDGSGSASNRFLNFQNLTVDIGADWSLSAATAVAETHVEGRLIVSASGSLSGAVTIEGGKAIFYDAYEGNVTFDGSGALKLSDAYTGVIAGLGAGDKIDLLSLSFQSGDKVHISGDVMSVETSSNTKLASLTLDKTSYVNSDFTVGQDALGHLVVSHT